MTPPARQARRGTPPFFYLRPDENVLARWQPEGSWGLARFVVVALLVTPLQALALAAGRYLPDRPPGYVAAVLGAYVLVLAVAGLATWRRVATTEYALTDQRIYARTGRLRTRVHFTTHDRVTDIRYRQGPIERIFGVSGIAFATAGGDVAILGVSDAIAVKEQAETARDTLLAQLLEKAGMERGARNVPAPTPLAEREPSAEQAPPRAPPAPWTGPRPVYLKSGDVPVWFGKPRLLAAATAALPILGVVPFLIISALSGQGASSTLAPFLALAAIALVAFRVIALMRTEYVVTDKRVYARSGVFGTTVTQLTYDKITDITYRQDLLGRLFGFGGLTVNTAGSAQAPAVMVGLAKPLDIKALIEQARARYLHEEGEE